MFRIGRDRHWLDSFRLWHVLPDEPDHGRYHLYRFSQLLLILLLPFLLMERSSSTTNGAMP
jgi:hypothetical protein